MRVDFKNFNNANPVREGPSNPNKETQAAERIRIQATSDILSLFLVLNFIGRTLAKFFQ
jgi:hypothetical protein